MTAGDSAGLLNSFHSRWIEAPLLLAPARAALPNRMQMLHFREVQRSVLGLFHCRADGANVACRLLGRWPALTFHNAVTSDDGHAVTRGWMIGPGLLARRAGSFGSLLLGAESRTAPNGRGEWRIWVEVKDYPSRFLPQAPTSHAVRVLIARLYLAAHGWVTDRYLDRLAATLREGAVQ